MLIENVTAGLADAAVSGRALFFQVSPDTDVRALVRDVVRHARRGNRRLRTAVASAADPAVPAWRQIALRLTRAHRTGTALWRSLFEWAGVVPVVGPLIGAVLNTIEELSDRPAPATAALGTGSAIDDVRRILAHGRLEPRLIVLTECEAADAAELSGAFALIQQLSGTRTLLLVIAADTGAAPARGFSDLLWEAERLRAGRRIAVRTAHDPRHSDLLDCAASIGPEFDAAGLALLMQLSEAEVEDRLAALVRANLVTLFDTVERDGDFVDLYRLVPTRPGAPADSP